MATVVATFAPLPERVPTPTPHLTLNTSPRGTPAPIPNKHLPTCSPGPTPKYGLETPPASPPQKTSVIEPPTLLNPPDKFQKILAEPPVYALAAASLAQAIAVVSSHPLPETDQVFPWLHGLHAENQIQLAFFVSRRKSLKRVPRCIRGITLVKAGGDLLTARLKGAIAPDEILKPHARHDGPGEFVDFDPRDGFSVRNFQIQAGKIATVSDIVVYGDASSSQEEILDTAKRLSEAQLLWRAQQVRAGNDPPMFHTFIVAEAFAVFEADHRHLVMVDSQGMLSEKVFDFFVWERREMFEMSKAAEISDNVYLGPTPDARSSDGNASPDLYDVYIEATDLAHMPEFRSLKTFSKSLQQPDHPALHIEFASSGSILPPTWSQVEADGLMSMCRWIYEITHGEKFKQQPTTDVADGDSKMIATSDNHKARRGKRVLIHCSDGYTESSLLALAYFMYAEGLPVHEAWIRLHVDKARNFFAYPSDVALLVALQPRILQESPAYTGDVLRLAESEPGWVCKLDGSLPSRVLPYMYLGNLNHANNPDLLKELGITRILSVGEPVNWHDNTGWPEEKLMYIDRVQDNGVDPLMDEFTKCLEFIEQGKNENSATLVHCRVGVSRSATICIAEVMKELKYSFPRAYTFVRARRLNVIIQPHLRFTYELLKWEEHLRRQRGQPVQRELEWATVAREIACMNRPYARQ